MDSEKSKLSKKRIVFVIRDFIKDHNSKENLKKKAKSHMKKIFEEIFKETPKGKKPKKISKILSYDVEVLPPFKKLVSSMIEKGSEDESSEEEGEELQIVENDEFIDAVEVLLGKIRSPKEEDKIFFGIEKTKNYEYFFNLLNSNWEVIKGSEILNLASQQSMVKKQICCSKKDEFLKIFLDQFEDKGLTMGRKAMKDLKGDLIKRYIDEMGHFGEEADYQKSELESQIMSIIQDSNAKVAQQELTKVKSALNNQIIQIFKINHDQFQLFNKAIEDSKEQEKGNFVSTIDERMLTSEEHREELLERAENEMENVLINARQRWLREFLDDKVTKISEEFKTSSKERFEDLSASNLKNIKKLKEDCTNKLHGFIGKIDDLKIE